ncbi:cobalamin biosynthesis protein [Aquimixticola soesokkakensis]|uniref:Cobalamin biosynthesis protein CobD n=2 Tax=Aquimixticola soesokkakensis TaxID=1519096 RepID=A0A1Y5RLT1_9RHOB|nr:adenosylcobinamide-phosphate synthase CbiB [Aquimixticola soesokkakensis]SLN17624.1 cobalamin biosynthesis protein [Aquimixticola soesokkakensis]
MAFTVCLALLLDAALGEPKWLWDRLPHPAVVMGRMIAAADQRFNTGARRRVKGVALVVVLVVAAGVIGGVLARIPLVEIGLGAILLAQKSLVEHLRAVARGLDVSLAQGRQSVAMIVGRDTADLDRAGVARAAIESGAENFSDGVIAPAFWFLIAGLPGILIYKVVNTADSMIGYRTERHADFGWAAARLDDVLNLIPARVTMVLLAPFPLRRAVLSEIRQDAGMHRSPNAGWPEAALARSLCIAVSGPRSYHGTVQDYRWVNAAGRREAGAQDIDAACRRLWQAWAVTVAVTCALGLCGLVGAWAV